MPQPFERDLLGEQLDAARDGIPASVSQRLLLNLPEASLDVALAATIEAKASTKVNIWQGLFARSAANAAPWFDRLANRIIVRVHGAAVGAGAELAAFAGRVEATADAWFSLPEVGMGLIPGAGGTVSIPRRVGRQRAARMCLTGERLDAPTAVAWGLVDELVA